MNTETLFTIFSTSVLLPWLLLLLVFGFWLKNHLISLNDLFIIFFIDAYRRKFLI